MNSDFSDIKFGKMVFSPDSRTMAYKVFTNRTYINIVSCETGKLLHSFTHDNGGKYIEILSFSPDGSRLAIGSNDSTLYEWDIEADTLTHKYKIFTIPWYDFADYSPDGKYLAVGRSEGEVEVISIDDGKKICSFNYTSVKGGIAGDISFTTDGKTLMLLGNGSYFFSYWDAMTGAFKRGYKHEVNGFITGFYSGKFADNRKIAITNLYDNTIWDAEQGTIIKTFPLYGEPPFKPRIASTMGITDDGSHIITFTEGTWYKDIEVYSTEPGELLATLTGTNITYIPYSTQLSVDNDKVVSVGSGYKSWDISTGKLLEQTFDNYFYGSTNVAHSPISSDYAVGTTDSVIFYNNSTAPPIMIPMVGKTIDGLEWSSNDEYLAVRYHNTDALFEYEYEKTIVLIDTKTKKVIKKTGLHGVESSGERMSIAPQGDRMAIMSPGLCTIVSLPNFDVLGYTVRGPFESVRYSSDGTILLAGEKGWERRRLVGNTLETIEVFLIPQPSKQPTESGNRVPCTISPDTRFFAIGYRGWVNRNIDSLLVVWDITQKKEVARFQSGVACISLVFSPDNKRLISLGIDGTICVWDIEQATTSVTDDLTQEVSSHPSLSIFPNPVHDDFTVRSSGIGTIRVRDVLGNIKSGELPLLNGEVMVSTSYFTSGVYFVEYVKNRNILLVKKILIYK